MINLKDLKINSANCSISVPLIDETVTCNVSFSRVGSLNYQFAIEIDLGNGFVESVMLTNTNTSTVALFETQYQTSGYYLIKLRIPVVNAEWDLSQVQIYGLKTFHR